MIFIEYLDKNHDLFVGIDWLSMSFDTLTHNDILDIFKIRSLEFKSHSILGYKNGLLCNGIGLYWDYDREKGKVFLNISGTGCRFLESVWHNLIFENSSDCFELDWFSLIFQFNTLILEKKVRVTRLDVCSDVWTDKYFDTEKILNHVVSKKFICKCKKDPERHLSDDIFIIYFGSNKSHRLLRIYDKALQMKLDKIWIRLELQLRDECALSFLLHWFSIKSIGETFSLVLFDFLRFTVKTNDNTHTERLKVCNWWTSFLDTCNGIKQAYLKGSEYTIDKLYNYVTCQTSSSLKTMLEINGGDVSELLEIIAHSICNQKQKTLITSEKLKRNNYEN